VNRYVKLNFSSTLEGSVLILTCENEELMSNTNATDEQILRVVCDSTATSWNPDPTDFIESCSSFTTALPGTYWLKYWGILPQVFPLSACTWGNVANKPAYNFLHFCLNSLGCCTVT
jgi:hypothetical protein